MSLSLASIIQTNIRELEDLINVPKSAHLDRIRATINQAKRKLVSLQIELTNLKSAELIIIQKMNRFQKLEDIERFYPYDRFQTSDPKQALDPIENYGLPTPDPRINWTRNQLLKGIEPLEAERNRIGNDVLKISQEILKQRQLLTEAQAELGTNSDVYLAKDQIAKRNYSELYMLLEICSKYRELSTDSAGNRKYNTDQVIIQKLKKLSMMFQAYAERNPYVLNKDLDLHYDDPGDDYNLKGIGLMLNRALTVMGNQSGIDLLNTKLEKYSNQMISNLNDSYISKNVARQDDSVRIPEDQNAFRTQTQTTSNVVAFVNETAPALNMAWTLTSYNQAIQSWFKNVVSKLNQDKPYCTKTASNIETSEDRQQQIIDQTQTTTDSTAQKTYATEFAKTKTVVNIEDINTKFNTLMASVESAINDPTGKETAGGYSLLIENVIYIGTSLYQAKILHNANSVVSYLLDTKLSGNLTIEQYTSYINNLTSELALANPAIQQKPKNS